MNAVFCKKDEAPVISNDAIQIKLNHLQEGLQDVRRSQSVLEDKMEKLDNKLDNKIDGLRTSLIEKMDALSKELFARFEKQGEQIKALDKRVDWVHISAKVVLAILGICVSAAVIVNALGALGWI